MIILGQNEFFYTIRSVTQISCCFCFRTILISIANKIGQQRYFRPDRRQVSSQPMAGGEFLRYCWSLFQLLVIKISNQFLLGSMDLGQSLRDTLSLNNVYRQLSVMSAMTPKLSFSLEVVSRLDNFLKAPLSDILEAVKQIQFLQLTEKGQQSKNYSLRLNYQNLQRTILVSGFSCQLLSQTLRSFNQSFGKLAQKLQIKGELATVVASNEFLATVLCAHEEISSHLQRFLRVKKKQEEGRRLNEKSIELAEKVRIVMGTQGLHQILVEVMVEYKAKMFYNSVRNTSALHAFPGNTRTQGSTPAIFYKLMFTNVQTSQPHQKLSNIRQNASSAQLEKLKPKRIEKESSSQQSNMKHRFEGSLDSTSESSDQNYVIDVGKEQDFAGQTSLRRTQFVEEEELEAESGRRQLSKEI